MTAVIVQITDWARPHVGRRLHRVKSRTRIDTQLRKMGLISGRGRSMQRHKPFVVTPNGEDYILQADWHRPLCDGEVLLVISAPPAGGNGGSRILAVLAIVALSIVTAGAAAAAYGAWVAGAGASAAAVAAASTSGMAMAIGAVAGAAVNIAGTMRLPSAMPEAVRA